MSKPEDDDELSPEEVSEMWVKCQKLTIKLVTLCRKETGGDPSSAIASFALGMSYLMAMTKMPQEMREDLFICINNQNEELREFLDDMMNDDSGKGEVCDENVTLEVTTDPSETVH